MSSKLKKKNLNACNIIRLITDNEIETRIVRNLNFSCTA